MYSSARLAHGVPNFKIRRVVPTLWQNLFVLLLFWAMWTSITRETGTHISLQKKSNVSLNSDWDFIGYIIMNPLSLTKSWAYLFPRVDGVVLDSKVSAKKTLLILLYRSIISLVNNFRDKLLSSWFLHSCVLLSMYLLYSYSDKTQILLSRILLTPFPRVAWIVLMLALTWDTALGPIISQMWPSSSSSWPTIGSENNSQGVSF